MASVIDALKLAETFAIFPLQPGAKVPLKGSKGFLDATHNPEVIEKWWNDNPDANIGIYPGHDYVILDIEGEAKGHKISTVLKHIARKTGAEIDLTEHYCVATPSGGRHVYFKVDDEDPRKFASAVKFVDGCDIRAIGGYVVGPYSNIGFDFYSATGPEGIKPLPSKLGANLPQKRKRSDAEDSVDADLEVNIKRASRFLQETDPAIEGFGGDAWTFQTACKLRGFGISEAKAVELMEELWNPRCEPPWESTELELKVANAYEYGLEGQGIEAADPSAFKQLAGDDDPVPAVPAPRPFALYSWGDVSTWPLPTWTVHKILPDTGIGLLIGPYGVGKTFIGVDLACSIITGLPFAGETVTRPGAVVYLAGEGPRGVKLRFEAWFKEQGLEPTDLFLADDVFNFGDPEMVKAFVEAALALGVEIRMVVVDTISQATLGADENSGKDMGAVIEGMKYIRDKLGCFVLGVHHMGKDEARGARGWSGLAAAADMEMRVSGKMEKREIALKLSKSRDSENWFEPRMFTGAVKDLGLDEDGVTVTSLAFRHDPSVKVVDPDKVSAADRLAALHTVLKEVFPSKLTLKLASEKVAAETFGREDWLAMSVTDQNDAAKSAKGFLERIANKGDCEYVDYKRRALNPRGEWWVYPNKEEEDLSWME